MSPPRKYLLTFLIALLAVPGVLLVKPKPANAIIQCLFNELLGGAGGLVSSFGDSYAVPVRSVAMTTTAKNTSSIKSSTKNLSTKECVWDFLTRVFVNTLIRNFTKSVVTWINSGFQGSPLFVTNPEGFFADVADQIGGQFIYEGLGKFGQILCSPFDLQLRLALGFNFFSNYRDRITCRLTDIQKNLNNAFTRGGFIVSGGWSTWHSVTMVRQNNVFGAYVIASDSLDSQLSRRINNLTEELNQGRGFLSFKKCPSALGSEEAFYEELEGKCTVQTPGSVIEGQLQEVLPSELRSIEVADEINEIIAALINAALNEVFSATGLAGTTQVPSGGGKSYWDRWSSGSIETDLARDINAAQTGKDPLQDKQDSLDGNRFGQNPPPEDLIVEDNAPPPQQTKIQLFDADVTASCSFTETNPPAGGPKNAVDGSESTFAGLRGGSCGGQFWWEVVFTQPESLRKIAATAFRDLPLDDATVIVTDALGGQKTFTLGSGTAASLELGAIQAKKVRIVNSKALYLGEANFFRNVPPTITLEGGRAVTVETNQPYTDPGVSIKDQGGKTIAAVTTKVLDQNGSAAAASAVSVENLTYTFHGSGIFYIEYTATDPASTLTTTTKRIVSVRAPRGATGNIPQ